MVKKLMTVGAIFHDGNGGYVCYSPNGVDVPREILSKLLKNAPTYDEDTFFEKVAGFLDAEDVT